MTARNESALSCPHCKARVSLFRIRENFPCPSCGKQVRFSYNKWLLYSILGVAGGIEILFDPKWKIAILILLAGAILGFMSALMTGRLIASKSSDAVNE